MAKHMTEDEIQGELGRTIDLDGRTSELEGFSSDEEDDPSYLPIPEQLNVNLIESSESEDDEDNVSNSSNLNTAFRPSLWYHSEIFEPLPPAPRFQEPFWEGKEAEPSEYFLKYIPEELFSIISQCTNRSSLSRMGSSLKTTAEEIKHFFGISVMMSYLGYPRIRMYWAAGTKVPQISNTMSRSRFFIIRKNLKLIVDEEVSDEEKLGDKFWKIRPLLHSVRLGCLQNIRSENVSLDEQMIPFWGHTSARQYIRGKPNPCGLKNFVCTSPDGLPLDFFLYEGKGDDILQGYERLDIGGKVVMRLARSLPPGCIIYMDRYFTSIDLLDKLHVDASCQGTGTIQISRIPSNCRLESDKDMKKRGRGSIDQTVRNDGQICILKWFDNKAVTLASSVDGMLPTGECRRWCKKDKVYKDVVRPNIVKKYNSNMGGVDLLDRIISTYRQSAKTRKWTIRVILHFFDFVCSAGWIEYRRDATALNLRKRETMDYLSFKIAIAEWLIHSGENELQDESDNEPPPKKKGPSPHPSQAKRKSGSTHMPEIVDDKSTHRCRMPGCKSVRARVICIQCNVHLCLVAGRNCFKAYHEM